MVDKSSLSFAFGNLSVFFSCVLCAFLGLVFWQQFQNRKNRKVYRYPISGHLKELLQGFINEVEEGLILDGKGEAAKSSSTFNWNVATMSPICKSCEKRVLWRSCQLEKGKKAGVWTLKCDVELINNRVTNTGTLVIAHLNEEKLFENGDKLVMQMERKAREILKEAKPW